MRKIPFKKTGLLFVSTSILAITGCQNDTQGMNESSQDVTVIMKSKSESNANGQVNFKEAKGRVTMEAQFTDLNAGPHAIHIHAEADCSANDGKSAGGHWNPTNEKHGKWGDKDGYHKGDIGNFEVDGNGKGEISMQTDQWCINCDDDSKNLLGKSVIVHQGSDDFVSQPSGDAGARVACGEIVK